MASLGVELSENGFCICALSGTGRDFQVESLTVEEFDESRTLAESLKAVREAIKRLNVPTDALALSVPLSKCMIRTIRLPFVDAEQARKVLPFEAESHFGCSADEFVLNYFPAGDDGASSRFLVVALPVAEMESYLAACSDAELDPDIIEADGVAYYYLARALADRLDAKRFLLLASERHRLLVLAVGPDGVAAVRSIATGSLDEARGVDNALLELEGAEMEPTPAGADPALAPRDGVLLNELKKTLLTLPDDGWGGTAVLVETEALSDDLKSALSQELALELVSVADVLSETPWMPAEPDVGRERCCCALGLAIEALTEEPGTVGFRKGRFALRDVYDLLRVPAVFVSMAAFLLALAAVGITWYSAHDFARRARNATEDVREIWQGLYPNQNRPADIPGELKRRRNAAVSGMGEAGGRPALRPVLEDWVEIESALRNAGIEFEWELLDAQQKTIIFREFAARSSEEVTKAINALGPYLAEAQDINYEEGASVFTLRVTFKED